jgi:hypothetical protein
MQRIVLPALDSYVDEGSEVGEVVRGLNELKQCMLTTFPAGLPAAEIISDHWEWNSLDPALKLQLAAIAALDGGSQTSFVQRFPEGDDRHVRVDLLGLDAPTVPAAVGLSSDLGYWFGPHLPSLKIEISQGPVTIELRSYSAPSCWAVSDSRHAEQPGEDARQWLLFGEYEEALAYPYAALLLYHGPDRGRGDKLLVPENMPTGPVQLSSAVELWNRLWAERTFSGIGSDEDVTFMGAMSAQLAASCAQPWMQLVAQGAQFVVYDHSWKPKGALKNGLYEILGNMHDFTIDTPAGRLVYDGEVDLWNDAGTWTLDDSPIDNDHPAILTAVQECQSGTWAWTGEDNK